MLVRTRFRMRFFHVHRQLCGLSVHSESPAFPESRTCLPELGSPITRRRLPRIWVIVPTIAAEPVVGRSNHQRLFEAERQQ
jgi:hypothetical protein